MAPQAQDFNPTKRCSGMTESLHFQHRVESVTLRTEDVMCDDKVATECIHIHLLSSLRL